MEFTNAFTVAAPIEAVWPIFLDAESVAPCVPGAQITEALDDTHFRGTVKVKLGAVQMSYRGDLEMKSDEAQRIIVLAAKGTETRGSGGASGTFTIRLTSTDTGGTHVELHSHLDVTGRVAQFGRGIMQDVANRMIKDFARCLEQSVEKPARTDAAAETSMPEAPDSGRTPDHGAAKPGEAQPSEAAQYRTAEMPAGATATRATYISPAQTGVSNELRLGRLLTDLARGRLAAGLRAVAGWLEPR